MQYGGGARLDRVSARCYNKGNPEAIPTRENNTERRYFYGRNKDAVIRKTHSDQKETIQGRSCVRLDPVFYSDCAADAALAAETKTTEEKTQQQA